MILIFEFEVWLLVWGMSMAPILFSPSPCTQPALNVRSTCAHAALKQSKHLVCLTRHAGAGATM